MLKLTLLTLTLLAAAPVFGQDSPDRTIGSYNGRYWTRLPEPVKAGVVVGFAMAMEVRLAVSKQDAEMFALRGTIGTIVRAVDDYYRREPDLNMPIWVVLHILKLEQDGVSQAEIGDRLVTDGIMRPVTDAPAKQRVP